MSAKAPKITPAQRQLEAMQLRRLKEAERRDNLIMGETAEQQRRMLVGTIGHNLFLEPGAVGAQTRTERPLPTAQAAGGPLAPSLTQPATTAAIRESELANMAGGYTAGHERRMKLLLSAVRPTL